MKLRAMIVIINNEERKVIGKRFLKRTVSEKFPSYFVLRTFHKIVTTGSK